MSARRSPLELILYVSSTTGEIERALEQVRAFLNGHGLDDASLDVIDLAHDPARGEADRVLATPTLVKRAPAPARRIVGSFGDARAVARALGLPGATGDSGGGDG